MQKILLIVTLIFLIFVTSSCHKSTAPAGTSVTDSPTNTIKLEETKLIETNSFDKITWDQEKYQVLVVYTPPNDEKNVFDFFASGCETESHTNIPTIEKTVTVDFMEQSYTGEYHRTYCTHNCSYLKHIYFFDNGRFSINSNGRLCGFEFSENKAVSSNDKISLKEAEEIAREFFEDFHQTNLETNGYALSSCKELEDSLNNKWYRIEFVKYINGIQIWESVDIELYLDGTIKKFSSSYEKNTFDNVDISSVNIDEINCVFEQATQYIFGGLENTTYEISGEPLLGMDGDGKLIFTYTAIIRTYLTDNICFTSSIYPIRIKLLKTE